jgi:hypothetical protein
VRVCILEVIQDWEMEVLLPIRFMNFSEGCDIDLEKSVCGDGGMER